jgi:hypothetical protein
LLKQAEVAKVIQLNLFLGVFNRSSVAKVDHAGKPSHLPDWAMAGDRSVSLNRYSDTSYSGKMFHVNLWIVLHCWQMFE